MRVRVETPMTLAVLPTRTSGVRPPTPPPAKTAFDGAPGDDSWLESLANEVRLICRLANAAKGEALSQMIELLDLRRTMIANEAMLYNALDDLPLPPVSDIPIDFLLAPTRESRILQGHLNALEECRARCERRLSRYRFEMRLSRDLNASES